MAIFHLKKEGFTLSASQKIIKAEDYLLKLEAERIIQKAKEEAKKIIDEAKQVYEKEKKRGYEDGIKEGKMRMTEQIIEMVNKSVSYFESIEEEVVKIVISALRKIIGEIDKNELIIRIVKNALTAARNQKQVIVRVSPDQLDVVRNKINEIMLDFPAISFIEVTADARLKAGGCIVESDIGIIDASVDEQLEAIYRSLLKSFKKGE